MNTTEDTEALPVVHCPFCGGTHVQLHSAENNELLQTLFPARIECMGCGALVSFRGAEYDAEASARWNQRGQPTRGGAS